MEGKIFFITYQYQCRDADSRWAIEHGIIYDMTPAFWIARTGSLITDHIFILYAEEIDFDLAFKIQYGSKLKPKVYFKEIP